MYARSCNKNHQTFCIPPGGFLTAVVAAFVDFSRLASTRLLIPVASAFTCHSRPAGTLIIPLLFVYGCVLLCCMALFRKLSALNALSWVSSCHADRYNIKCFPLFHLRFSRKLQIVTFTTEEKRKAHKTPSRTNSKIKEIFIYLI